MLDIQGRKYAAVTVCDVTLYDLVTKYPVMYFDTLQVTSIDGTTEVTEIQGGKGNPILASVSHSKTVDVQFDDAIMTMSSLALLTGGNLERADNEHKITMTQTELVELGAGADVITLSEKVKEGTYVWAAKMVNGVLSTATRTTAKAGKDVKEVKIADLYNAEVDSEASVYRVFYEYEKGVEAGELSELTVLADKFAGTYRFIGDTVLFNQFTGLNDIFQIEIPKLKLDSSFSFNLNAATEAVVFSFKGKALRDDEGQMIKFRQLRVEGKSGEETYGQFDGQFKRVPAKEVTVDSVTSALKDTGVTYPLDRDYNEVEQPSI